MSLRVYCFVGLSRGARDLPQVHWVPPATRVRSHVPIGTCPPLSTAVIRVLEKLLITKFVPTMQGTTNFALLLAWYVGVPGICRLESHQSSMEKIWNALNLNMYHCAREGTTARISHSCSGTCTSLRLLWPLLVALLVRDPWTGRARCDC